MGLKVARKAKVNDLNIEGVVFNNEQVLWLEISMHDFLRMTVANGRKQLFHNFRSYILVKVLGLQD